MSLVGLLAVIILMILLLITIATQFVGASAAIENPRRGKVTKVPGGKIHWVDNGSGEPIVMIHGLGSNLHNFTYSLSSKLTDEFRVIALDRPGCGWSERDSADRATLQEQARMIAYFIQTEGLGKPLIVGHSLGGAIAETLALNHPEQVGALALLCPATNEVEDLPAAFKGIDVPYPWLIPVIGHTLAGVMSLVQEKKVFSEVFKPEPVAPEFLEKGGGILGRRPEGFIAASQDLAKARASVGDVVGRENELTLPIGVLFGASDNILSPEYHGRQFSEKTGAEYSELPDRGHMIPLTAPEDCARFIREMASKQLQL